MINLGTTNTPTSRQLRSFSLITFLGFTVLAYWAWHKSSQVTFFVLLAADVLILAGQFSRPFLKVLYRFWMRLGTGLGWLSSRILLSLIFYLIFTPTGLFLRLIKKSLLDLRFPDTSTTFWQIRQKSQSDLTKMF